MCVFHADSFEGNLLAHITTITAVYRACIQGLLTYRVSFNIFTNLKGGDSLEMRKVKAEKLKLSNLLESQYLTEPSIRWFFQQILI